ncbi:RadC family protein [Syntrophorhabdus aromaticivorans]|uniref:DNA repair protein RadC n=1 Tax=Syntrophorhabdus aromaticivorans TaxID=328301 RepID=A0A351U1V8_9BACT|nr:DNA repair protein RadC [Syntrophorhabdus aromaticivorans]NLW36892.1 DNA repair protein RadC [Syntrophorhabdus aromaticivorans]HBA53939.1 JAB domain-containing protein [Syntrophorhabdus aromaticivorans]
MLKDETAFTVRDLPRQERPRERLQRFGAEALSTQELLALIIGRGVAKRSVMDIAQDLVRKFGSVKGLSRATAEELSKVKGIGIAKAAQILACFELAIRQDLEGEMEDLDIRDPADVVKMVRAGLRDKAKEHFKLVLLNTRNRVIGISTISIGTLNASLVHPREVFKEAVVRSAASVILVHNHPSNDLEPSEEDIRITRRMVEAGKIMGIEVLDHIIITRYQFVSLKAQGLW